MKITRKKLENMILEEINILLEQGNSTYLAAK